jgi:hypothetical protein
MLKVTVWTPVAPALTGVTAEHAAPAGCDGDQLLHVKLTALGKVVDPTGVTVRL